MAPLVYLDTCCLNRPFDDLSLDRIRLEADAVGLIFQHIERNGWEWIGSEVLSYEIRQMRDVGRRAVIEGWLAGVHRKVAMNASTVARAEQLQPLGFHRYDALHIASAEQGEADVLLTTDDRFLKAARRHANQLKTTVSNPLAWITSLLETEERNDDN